MTEPASEGVREYRGGVLILTSVVVVVAAASAAATRGRPRSWRCSLDSGMSAMVSLGRRRGRKATAMLAMGAACSNVNIQEKYQRVVLEKLERERERERTGLA